MDNVTDESIMKTTVTRYTNNLTQTWSLFLSLNPSRHIKRHSEYFSFFSFYNIIKIILGTLLIPLGEIECAHPVYDDTTKCKKWFDVALLFLLRSCKEIETIICFIQHMLFDD